jgi:hypothetical protein
MKQLLKNNSNLITFQEIITLREAFHSCQLSGINMDMKFDDYLIETIERRQTCNKWLKSVKEIAKSLEGSNRYVGDYWIPEVGCVCTCFKNSNPNLEKGHKEFPFLYNKGTNVFISAFDKEQWENCKKVKCIL